MQPDTTISNALTRAGVPARYLDAEPRPDLLAGVYLFGKAGVGKTHAACGALRAYADSKIYRLEDGSELYRGNCRFVNAPAWFAELRGTYSHRDESEQDVFNRYANCKLLVLDDLGKGTRSEWAVERLYMLIDHRYANALPTIITSNYDLGELAARLSTDAQTMDAIASRIGGMCAGLRMDGPDRRLQR